METNYKPSKSYRFIKCYAGMIGAFSSAEVVFMLYMSDLAFLRSKGYDTVRSKRRHMECTHIRSRKFDRCVEKMTRMGLLQRVPVGGMYDYLWNMDSYERLIEILSLTKDLGKLRTFCERVFEVEQRPVSSITNDDIMFLGEK